MKKLLFITIAFIFACTSHADAVTVTSTTGEFIDGQSVQIDGADFLTKTVPAPRYLSNWDGMSTGSAPTGWTVEAGTPTVETTRSYTSPNAVKFVNTGVDFQQLSRDMGTLDTYVFRGKIYLDNSNDTLSAYQWKHVRMSSSTPPYGIGEEINTSIMLYDTFWEDLPRWYGGGSPFSYYNGGTQGGSATAPATLFPFNEWFDMTIIFKRASGAGVADGEAYTYTNYELKNSGTSFITHDADDGVWRYMLMGGTIHAAGDATGTEDFNVYYDDVYIDDTESVVLICDESTETTSTHCEAQPATTWADGEIDITINQSVFVDSESAYLIIKDSTGTPSVGYPITFADSSTTTSISATGTPSTVRATGTATTIGG